tara:strand:- start:68 stop:337 length:270 start_codon:yes stop_codon:yes gene_type:complete
MAKVKNLKAPVGWLIDPNNKWVIHFDFKKTSSDHIGADFIIDMWGLVPNGKPMEFKSRRKVTQEDSLKIWNQLLDSNWVKSDIEMIKTA